MIKTIRKLVFEEFLAAIDTKNIVFNHSKVLSLFFSFFQRSFSSPFSFNNKSLNVQSPFSPAYFVHIVHFVPFVHFPKFHPGSAWSFSLFSVNLSFLLLLPSFVHRTFVLRTSILLESLQFSFLTPIQEIQTFFSVYVF